MKEVATEYVVVDEDGDATLMRVVNRYCNCTSPGCVDDTLEIHDVPGDHPSRLHVPRDMMYYLQGVLEGRYTVRRPTPGQHGQHGEGNTVQTANTPNTGPTRAQHPADGQHPLECQHPSGEANTLRAAPST